MNRLMLTCALLIIAVTTSGQPVTTGLNDLLDTYGKSKTDTNKVHLLLQLDSFYLYKMPDTDNILDSALLMAQQAVNTSKMLRFERGYQEGMFLLANAFAEKNNVPAALEIASQVKGGLQVHIMIMLAEHYIFKPGQLKENLDLAYPFVTRAQDLSDSLRSSFWIYQSLCVMGKYYFAYGNLTDGRNCFMRMIRDYQRSGNKSMEAFWWAELGRYMPHTDSTYADAVHSLETADILYQQTGDMIKRQEVLEDMAYLHQVHNELEPAEKKLLEAVKFRKSTGITRLYNHFCSLSEISALKGNYNTSLYYALEALENLRSLGEETYGGGVVYSHLADAYNALGETDKSIEWYKMALQKIGQFQNEYTFTIGAQIVHGLLLKGNAREAMSFLQTFIAGNTPQRLIDREMIAASLGDCYHALGNYRLAEENYLRMIALDALARANMKKETQGERANKITGAEAYYKIGQFYVERKKYETARTYLTQALSFNRFTPPLSRVRDIHGLLFIVDSAQGNYLSAIGHLSVQKQLNDSIFNERKSRQIEELKIKYETEKTEKDLQVLRAKEQVQNKELQKNRQGKIFTYVLLITLIILLIAGFSRFRLKQKSNLLLRAKQEEINQNNISLQHALRDKNELIIQKDSLLEEKEWLLKEVNHRVKNNLQIVLSLLNTQSKYLDNQEAVDAISNSTHRMHAMSLVHKELYQNKNASTVNMKAYIHELTHYLADSFPAESFRYDLKIAAIELDIMQAIPIGLMLNEMITNAIKYAFPGKENGTISIAMKKDEESHILLEVWDNGKGFDDGVDLTGTNTMGLRLVKGLAGQIGGKVVITNAGGVRISIRFKAEAS